jgi:hypothetical protein
LYSICRHFLLHRKKQGYKVVKWDDGIQYDKYNFTIIGKKEADLNFYLFNSGTYIYGVDEKKNVEIPLHRFTADIKIEQDTFKIGTKKGIYYNKIYREITHEGRNTKFGKSFTIGLPENNKVNINFKETGNLRERIKDCKFLVEIVKNKSILLNETEMPLNMDENDKQEILEGLPKYIDELEDVLVTLKMFGINPEEDFDELKRNEKQLIMLRDIILKKDTKKYKITEKNFQEFHIGRYKIILARGSRKFENKLFNFFNYDELKEQLRIAISTDEEFENYVEHSPYINLKPDLLYNYSNLNVNSIKNSLTDVKYNTQIAIIATNKFLLDTLEFYDKQTIEKNKDILDMFMIIY